MSLGDKHAVIGDLAIVPYRIRKAISREQKMRVFLQNIRGITRGIFTKDTVTRCAGALPFFVRGLCIGHSNRHRHLVYHESMKAILVAMDKNNGIGADNDLLWQRDLPADLAHFKHITMGGTVIMGRKTFESIGRPLPGRENIVVSRSDITQDGIIAAKSLPEAYQKATHENVYVIGGGQIYEQALGDMDVLYVTHVDAHFPQATVFFPQISCEDWQETAHDHHEADKNNRYSFDFVEYTRQP